MKKTKAETKTDPTHTSDEAPSRVTADTVVTDGPSGLARLRALTRRLLGEGGDDSQPAPKPSSTGSS